MIRTLIVDGERQSRETLRGFLADEKDVEIVGELEDGCQAVSAIEEDKPDLVFLDVPVSHLDAVRMLEHLGPLHIPAVVFVTANEQLVLHAFDVRAVDYLLKPFRHERLRRALGRVRDQIALQRSSDLAGLLAAFLEEKGAQKDRHLKHLMVKEGGRLFLLRTPDIDWVEASGNYVRLHVGAASHLLRLAMKTLEERLDPEAFRRINRSAIVNIERIKELRPLLHGDFMVVLRDDRQLTMRAAYRDKLDDWR